MDPGLFNRKTSVSPCRPQHLEHYHTEHRCPTRLCSSRCWPMTALPSSTNHIIKFADDTTVVGLISNNNEMHYREEVWLNGVALIICPSMWGRQRRLCWTSGETLLTTPHWPSTARLWRESAALNSWGCTSQRISPGPPTPCHSPRRHNSAYTFSAGWKEQVSLQPSSPHSTGAPLRVCWPAASLPGTGTVVQQTARPYSGQWTQLQRSSIPLSHPSWTFSLHDAPAKPTASWRTPPIPPTVSSSSCHQEDGTGASEPLRQTAQQLFPPGCESHELKSPRPPSENPMQTPTYWNMDHLTFY